MKLDLEYFKSSIIRSDLKVVEEIANEIDSFYEVHEIDKKRGKRIICKILPDTKLYQIQKRLNAFLNDHFPLPNCVHGYVKKRSYSSYLSVHRNKKYYMKLDVKNFFGSINEDMIITNLKDLSNSTEVLNAICSLCLLNGSLPQGAITSPTISNLVFRFLDQRILKYCQVMDVSYTRYADDMMFSSNKVDFKLKNSFYKKINYILNSCEFELNSFKTSITETRMVSSGYVVGNNVHLSRKKMKNLNTILYSLNRNRKLANSPYEPDENLLKSNYLEQINNLELIDSKNQKICFESQESFCNYLAGMRAFLISIIKSNNSQEVKLLKNMNSVVKKIEKVLLKLSNINV